MHTFKKGDRVQEHGRPDSTYTVEAVDRQRVCMSNEGGTLFLVPIAHVKPATHAFTVHLTDEHLKWVRSMHGGFIAGSAPDSVWRQIAAAAPR